MRNKNGKFLIHLFVELEEVMGFLIHDSDDRLKVLMENFMKVL